jgi:putative transposase
VHRYHQHYKTSGHVWQGRFKAFPIEQDDHLLTVLRYIERNPLRAGLVERAEDWRWSSLSRSKMDQDGRALHLLPVTTPADWIGWVNQPQTDAELEGLRHSVNWGTPYGSADWVQYIAAQLGLEASLRPRGRPQKQREK